MPYKKTLETPQIVMGTATVEVGPGAESTVDLNTIPGWSKTPTQSVVADYVEIHLPEQVAGGTLTDGRVYWERGATPGTVTLPTTPAGTTGTTGSPSVEVGGKRILCACRNGSAKLNLRSDVGTHIVELRTIRIVPRSG